MCIIISDGYFDNKSNNVIKNFSLIFSPQARIPVVLKVLPGRQVKEHTGKWVD